jgi:hypothetical protein
MNKWSIYIALIFFSALITACKPSSPMKIDLDILQDPIVGREVDLIIVLRSSSDAPNTWVEITIPEGIQIIQGVTEFGTSLQRNKKFKYPMKIRVLKEGQYLISAYAFNRYSDGGASGFGAGETIYILSDRTAAKVLSWDDVRSTPAGPCLNCETLSIDPTYFED